jgi:dihydroorotase
MIIKNGTVLDPATQVFAPRDLFISGDRIAERGDGQVIDATGLIVCPGLIDIHVHLREPGQGYKETIHSGTLAAAAGGFTSVCCMPNTVPVNDSVEITRWMQAPERSAVINVFPIAAATIGSMGDALTNFAELTAAGVVAVSDDGKPILGDDIMRECLITAKAAGIPVVQHAEDTRRTQHAPMNAGPVALRLGLRGWDPHAETAIVERDIELARSTGARLHVAHISTAGAVDAVRRAKSEGLHVTCEVTPHHLALCDRDISDSGYDANLKMNPPLRSDTDQAALIAGVFDGTIDAIATDHAPHAAHEKAREFETAPFGITGLETALGLCIEELHVRRGLPLSRIVSLLSTSPANVMGLRGRGTLSPGSYADITIVDPHERWTYHASASLSKSKNSPFDGYELQGRVRRTIVGGRVVFEQ